MMVEEGGHRCEKNMNMHLITERECVFVCMHMGQGGEDTVIIFSHGLHRKQTEK